MNLRRVVFSFVTLFFLTVLLPVQAETNQGHKIQWMTNYEKATELAKETQRPIVLFFTGSDWCGWCNKLEKEVLETRDFMGMTSNKLIFVKLDFPMKTKLDLRTTKQNEDLQKKFSIRSFPTIVLVDPYQQPIGVTGYRSGGGKQYAQHLMKMVNEHTAYKQQMKRLGSHKFSGKELKRLYQKAHELDLESDKNLLVRVGMESDLAHYFLTERYRFLVNQGQIKSKEAAALRQRLLTIDPDNQFLTHYQVAVIDFEACCEQMETTKISLDDAVKPLITYMDHYGANDTENVWRLNMVISQVYLDQNRLDVALKFAKQSYTAAPSTIQSDIAMAIKSIEKQIMSSN